MGKPSNLRAETLRPDSAVAVLSPAFSVVDLEAPPPILRREGIRWTGGIGGHPLLVALDFVNPGEVPTREVVARIETAPFGAFVPGRPLTSVRVPRIAPGGRATIRTMAARWSVPTLAALQDRLLGGANWVGNINVFVSDRDPVERHMREAVALEPGVPNIAAFFVGDAHRDAYAFSPESVTPGWWVALSGGGVPIREDVFVRVPCGSIMAEIVPPENADCGSIHIDVMRESDRRTARVEFELSTGRAGARCYSFPA